MEKLNEHFTSIYYYLRPEHDEKISHQSVRILQTLEKEGALTVRNIAERFSISHNTASEHIKKLEKNNWVSKTRLSIDQRVVTIQLTKEGEEVVRLNTQLDSGKLEHVINQLTSAEQEKVMHVFQRLSEVAKDVYGR